MNTITKAEFIRKLQEKPSQRIFTKYQVVDIYQVINGIYDKSQLASVKPRKVIRATQTRIKFDDGVSLLLDQIGCKDFYHTDNDIYDFYYYQFSHDDDWSGRTLFNTIVYAIEK